jgi:hypothetical protein
MSIREFHSQLVSGNNKNALIEALRKLSLIADPKSLFTEETSADWPLWDGGQSSHNQSPAAA